MVHTLGRALDATKTMIFGFIILAFLATVTIVAPEGAYGYGLPTGSCDRYVGTSGAPVVLKVYEDKNFAGSEVLCIRTSGSLGISNLKTIPFTDGSANICSLQFPTSNGTWNDCISSTQWNMDCHQSIKLYYTENYADLQVTYYDSGSVSELPFEYNDRITGIKVTYTAGGCQ